MNQAKKWIKGEEFWGNEEIERNLDNVPSLKKIDFQGEQKWTFPDGSFIRIRKIVEFTKENGEVGVLPNSELSRFLVYSRPEIEKDSCEEIVHKDLDQALHIQGMIKSGE